MKSLVLTLALSLFPNAVLASCPTGFSPWANAPEPFFLAIGPSGNVYVTSSSANNVFVFDSNGGSTGTWGTPGSGPGQLSSPSGVAVDADGKVYIADTGNSRIEVFTSAGAFDHTIQNVGTGVGQFILPVDIAIGPANDLFIVDKFTQHPKIVRLSLNGAFSDIEWGIDPGNGIYDIAVDGDGTVYGYGIGTANVMAYSSSGSLLRSWPPAAEGENAARLDVRNGIVCSSLLGDAGFVLRSFDGFGTTQCSIPGPGLGGIATGPDNKAFVGDVSAGSIGVVEDAKVPTIRWSWGELKERYR